MPDFIFDDPNKFADWLESFDYFDGGYLAEFNPLPSSNESLAEPVETVGFKLLLMIGGSYDAGQKRLLTCYDVLAKGVQLWNYSSQNLPDYSIRGPLIEGISVDDESSKLDLILDEKIHLQCRSISITKLKDQEVLNLPFVSNSSATICLADTELPTPVQWIEWLKNSGTESAWSYFCGEHREAETLPQQEYEGWFLKLRSCTDVAEGGVMFKSLVSNSDGAFIELEDYYRKPTESGYSQMWIALCSAVAKRPGLTVRTGNCLLTGSEWFQTLNDGDTFLRRLDFEKRISKGEPNGWYPSITDNNAGWPSRVRSPEGTVANFGIWPYIRKKRFFKNPFF